jgi:probable rRNA maturation factor
MVNALSREVCRELLAKPSAQTAEVDIKAVCERALVSVILTSNRTIRKLNKQWRGKDSPTDVLSFAMLLEAPPKEMPWELGEIFISVEQAVEQAHSYNHGLEREMAFLTAHGLLHLLGFDHIEPAQETEMLGRQEKILKAAGYPR